MQKQSRQSLILPDLSEFFNISPDHSLSVSLPSGNATSHHHSFDQDNYSATTKTDSAPSFSMISSSSTEISIQESSSQNHSSQSELQSKMECNDQQLPLPDYHVVPPVSEESPCSAWCGFKIVGDNLDSMVKPRYMHKDNQNKSLHFFNSIAVKDRIDFSSLSDEVISDPLPPHMAKDVLLPSKGDDAAIYENFTFLMKKIVIDHLDFFAKTFTDIRKHHIKHRYSNEMAQKSHIVSRSRFTIYYIC